MGFKLTCPECEATLNLAKAVAPGKKMKCPRCAAVFTVPEGDPEPDEAPAPPRKKAAAQKTAPGIKKGVAAKAPPGKAAPPAPASKLSSEEEESAGVYGLKTSEDDEHEAEAKKPKIDYAPDLSNKDPRGPATTKVASVSNALLLMGSGTALLGLFVSMSGWWPFLFADHMFEPKKMQTVFIKLEDLKKSQDATGVGGGGPTTKKKTKGEVEKEELNIIATPRNKLGASEQFLGELTPEEMAKKDPRVYERWEELCEEVQVESIWKGIIGLVFAGLGGVVAYGSVRLQNLESYNWSLACLITAGVVSLALAGGLMYLGFSGMTEDGNEEESKGAMGVLLDSVCLLAGFGCLIGGGATVALGIGKLKDPQVLESFTYDPEAELNKTAAKDKEEEDEDEDEEDDEEDED